MKALKHFITITKHKNLVFKHAVKAGIPLRGLLHDLSKYGPTEFLTGSKHYMGTKSPNEKEIVRFLVQAKPGHKNCL